MTKSLLTPWQRVIFRNYGAVKSQLIGKVVNLSEEQVVYHANALGLGAVEYEPSWQKDGFVTLIRNNWDILTEKDIATLLELTEKELKTLLVEYDFLDVKLGVKPSVEGVNYYPLTEEEQENTKKVKELVQANFTKRKVKPFTFFDNFSKPYYLSGNGGITDRFASSYCAKYSGSLLDDNLSDYSDDYLQKLASTGTNGIWLSDTLRNLAEFPFDKTLSPDYQIRVRNLRKLTERCEKHGIKVYLYINEPRSLPKSFFDKYPDLKGQDIGDGTYCLCTSKKQVRDYLYNAIKSVAENVPKLYAVMTISMSENPTHCYSRPWDGTENIATTCPNCIGRKPQEIVAEVNNTIYRALNDGNGYTKLITNIWGWVNYSGKDKKEVFETLDLLDKDIDVLCVSEYAKEFVRGGVAGKVDDYSISVGGPSDFSQKVLTYARDKGHRIWAKVQMNASWECSAVPYLPAFGLMVEHVKRLKALQTNGIMLGWSLGGYPGGVLSLVNTLCENHNFDESEWYKNVYGENAKTVQDAVKIFDDAFTNYPFSVYNIYFGGHNLGCGNLWSFEKQNRESTMVCFAFDDLDRWTTPYGVDIYLSLMGELCSKWEEGLKLIDGLVGNSTTEEFIRCAKGAYIHLKSALNLATFSKCKSDVKVNYQTLKDCIDNEKKLTKALYELFIEDSKIGFEMTNHYYYNENLLLEKLINLKEIENELNLAK